MLVPDYGSCVANLERPGAYFLIIYFVSFLYSLRYVGTPFCCSICNSYWILTFDIIAINSYLLRG